MKTAVLPSIPAFLDYPVRLCALVFTAIGLGLALVLGFAQGAVAQQNDVTAVDIALEPDATMLQHAKDANARLLKSFPKGFTLDETHHPHVTMLQQFVRTADLDKVFAAANAVLAKEKPTSWTLKAFKYYYIPSPPVGLAGIVVEPTEDLHRLQDELIKAVEPYTAKTGTPAAFFSEDGGRDIQEIPDRVRLPLRYDRGGQAFQSACDDRRRNGNLLEQDVGRAIRLVHVLGDWRIGLSAWHFWHSSEGTEGVAAGALRRGTKNDWKRVFAVEGARMSPSGTSRHFAARWNLVAIGA